MSLKLLQITTKGNFYHKNCSIFCLKIIYWNKSMYCVVFNCNVPLSPYTGSSSDWPDSHRQVWDREGLLPGAWGVLGAVLWLHRHLEATQQSGGGVHDWDECPRGRHHRQTCFSRPLWWYQMGGSTIFSIISLNLSWFLSRENLIKIHDFW